MKQKKKAAFLKIQNGVELATIALRLTINSRTFFFFFRPVSSQIIVFFCFSLRHRIFVLSIYGFGDAGKRRIGFVLQIFLERKN